MHVLGLEGQPLRRNTTKSGTAVGGSFFMKTKWYYSWYFRILKGKTSEKLNVFQWWMNIHPCETENRTVKKRKLQQKVNLTGCEKINNDIITVFWNANKIYFEILETRLNEEMFFYEECRWNSLDDSGASERPWSGRRRCSGKLSLKHAYSCMKYEVLGKVQGRYILVINDNGAPNDSGALRPQ